MKMLEKAEAIIIGISFKVADLAKAAVELEHGGIQIQHKFDKSHDYVSIGMDNFSQVVAKDEDIFGIIIGFSTYDRIL